MANGFLADASADLETVQNEVRNALMLRNFSSIDDFLS
jgi:hypothetical protein